MYMKNLSHRMTLRLDDDLFEFVNVASEVYRISPSDFIRQCIGTAKFGFDHARKTLDAETSKIVESGLAEISEKLGKEGFENGIDRKADNNDLVQHP